MTSPQDRNVYIIIIILNSRGNEGRKN